MAGPVARLAEVLRAAHEQAPPLADERFSALNPRFVMVARQLVRMLGAPEVLPRLEAARSLDEVKALVVADHYLAAVRDPRVRRQILDLLADPAADLAAVADLAALGAAQGAHFPAAPDTTSTVAAEHVLYRVEDAAAHLGVDADEVARAMETGRLRGVLCVPGAELERLRRGREQAEGPEARRNGESSAAGPPPAEQRAFLRTLRRLLPRSDGPIVTASLPPAPAASRAVGLLRALAVASSTLLVLALALGLIGGGIAGCARLLGPRLEAHGVAAFLVATDLGHLAGLSLAGLTLLAAPYLLVLAPVASACTLGRALGGDAAGGRAPPGSARALAHASIAAAARALGAATAYLAAFVLLVVAAKIAFLALRWLHTTTGRTLAVFAGVAIVALAARLAPLCTLPARGGRAAAATVARLLSDP